MVSPTDAEPERPAAQRLFFALWPDASLQHRIHALARTALARGNGRLVAPGNLHLTLAFLGAVDADRRRCLEAAAGTVRTGRFSLEFDVAGYWAKPRVLWFGCSRPPQALLDLVASLQSGVRACGFDPDRRPYAVHLTVARSVAHNPGAAGIAPLYWPVDGFVLVESQTRPEGAQYRPLRAWAL